MGLCILETVVKTNKRILPQNLDVNARSPTRTKVPRTLGDVSLKGVSKIVECGLVTTSSFEVV